MFAYLNILDRSLYQALYFNRDSDPYPTVFQYGSRSEHAEKVFAKLFFFYIKCLNDVDSFFLLFFNPIFSFLGEVAIFPFRFLYGLDISDPDLRRKWI